MNESKFNSVINCFQNFFSKKVLTQKSKEHGFVKRVRNLTGSSFAKMCILSCRDSGLDSSLTELSSILARLGVTMSPQSLNQRFQASAVSFMKDLFGMCISTQLGHPKGLPLLEGFSGVYLEDATLLELPSCLSTLYKGSGGDASTAGLKIDLTYEISYGQDWHIRFRDAVSSDTTTRLDDIKPNSLWLRDMGYFKVSEFHAIDQAKAYFISRLKYAINIYDSTDLKAKPLDLIEWMYRLEPNQIEQKQVYLGNKARFPVRFIIQRVPEEVTEQKRNKLKIKQQKKQNKVSANRFEICGANLFITNLTEKQSPALKVMTLYRIRWQIEILFKVWKSILRFRNIPKMNPHRFECLLYGQMIWALMNVKIFFWFKVHFWKTQKIELSELKGVKILRTFHDLFIQAIIIGSKPKFLTFLNLLEIALSKLAKKKARYRNLLPYQILSGP